MNVARTRIGRVRFKAGGEIVPLHRPKAGETNQHLREAVSHILNGGQQDAYVLVTWQVDEARPGWPWVSVQWHTTHHAFPVGALPSMAIDYIRRNMAGNIGENGALERLGYNPTGWEPDAS